MKQINPILLLIFLTVMPAMTFFAPDQLFAHCDAMDGPVVKAARKALETGNVNLVLIWVQKHREAEIKQAFEKTMVVRAQSPEAKSLADMYFFETLVRIHRTGEGAPYTGLKPTGGDLGAAVPAVDRALESGSVASLIKLVTKAVESGLAEKFHHAMTLKNFSENDVEAGREYVEAYVTLMHYAKRIYDSALEAVEGHFPEATSVDTHNE